MKNDRQSFDQGVRSEKLDICHFLNENIHVY